MEVLKTTKPNPGTKEATRSGCKCPVIDNNYGKGYMGQENVFVYSMDCPIHTANLTLDKNGLELN
jgi:hypothetical protein